MKNFENIMNKEQFWDDDKVIDFVNWYVDLHKLGIRYKLENQTIIDSFKNGDDPSVWHIADDDVSGLACKCGNRIFTHRHSNWIECTACNRIQILQAK